MEDKEYLNKEYPIGFILDVGNMGDIPENLKRFKWKFIRTVGRHKYYEREK